MAQKTALGVTCAICERSLLVGEQPLRFAPDGRELVNVCPLCQDAALDHGWIREGSPTLPTTQAEHERRRGWLSSLFAPRRQEAGSMAAEPTLRRLSPHERAIVETADLFNASSFRRTVEGIARSLGPPWVSVVRLSGVNREVVITIAWDISWYQYRITFDSVQPVRLAERGLDLEQLDGSFSGWNAQLGEDGRVVPEIART